MKMKKGFTLIELLVVIAIIGILSTIAVIALQSARTKSRDAKRVADAKQIQTALEMCFSDSACASGGYPVQETGDTDMIVIPNYMTTAPTSPSPADGTCDTDNAYFYQSVQSTVTNACAAADAPCASYLLQFCLGAATGDMAPGLHCASPTGVATGACVWGT